MAPIPRNRIGKRYGRMVVVENPPSGHGQRDPKFKCRCDCGTETLVPRSNLRSTKSCGCSYKRYGTLRERLEQSSIPEPNSGCWLWLGSLTRYNEKDNYGAYGTTSLDGKKLKAHRAAYETYVGPIPAGIEVCHFCDNPYCINPDHLFLGTHLENMKDRDRKGRRKAPRGAANGCAKLTDEKVRLIKAALGSDTQDNIATKFGIEQSTISLIKLGKRWSHVA